MIDMKRFCSSFYKTHKQDGIFIELIQSWHLVFFDSNEIMIYSKPYKISGNILFLKIDPSVYFFINTQKQVIMDRLNKYFHKTIVSDIRLFNSF